MVRLVTAVAAVMALALGSSCGSDAADQDPPAAAESRPTIAVATAILGDVVGELVGDQADVVTIMPAGANPHVFQASARDAAKLREAATIIINGAGLEEGLLPVIEGAEADGVPVYAATDAVELLPAGANGDDHGHEGRGHEGDGHEGDEHGHEGDEHGHDGGDGAEGAGARDPHFFTDPLRMVAAVRGIAAHLATVEDLDESRLDQATSGYVTKLESLHARIAARMDAIPADRRVLITNHPSMRYFAERYGFTVPGTVLSGSTAGTVSGAELAELANVIAEHDVPAIFVDDSAPDDLAQRVAEEVGEVEVVDLYTESLGSQESGADTYLAMIETNAGRIAAALSPEPAP